MAERPILSQFLDRHALGSWIAQHMHIWQMETDLLDPGELAKYCDKRGVQFRDKHILQLWRVGLLQADIVVAERRFKWQGFAHVGRDEYGQHLYADERVLQPLTEGWQQALASTRAVPKHISPRFHPFRYYVLFHLQRLLEVHIAPIQTLFPPSRYHNLLDFELRSFDQWSCGEAAAQVLQYWSDAASLAIVAEPCVYERMFGTFRRHVQVKEQEQRQQIAEQWENVRRLYTSIGLEQLEQVRQDMAFDAYRLDQNRSVQTLICLTADERRLKMEGNLGGALFLRTMVEVIRRAAEDVFDTKLREEDETGFYWTPSGRKERLYDDARLLDGNPTATKEYLRLFGLTPDTVLRWYVEGDTELFALSSFFGDAADSRVKLVNLHGAVAEKAGVAFRESLRADLESHIFSFVSIDEDVGRNVSAVRRAAEVDQICGAFFISYPDFEFANFTLDELEAVLWSMAQEDDVPEDVRDKLHEALQGTTTAKELMKRASKVLREYIEKDVSKGETWGEKLIEYALAHPTREHEGKTETRLVMEALRMALSMSWGSYVLQKRESRVDPDAGLPIPRSLMREDVAAHIKSNFPWFEDIRSQRQRMKSLVK